MPRETTDRFIAIGNDESCSATGFLIQLGTSSYLYNAMLSIYFLLVIRYGVGSQKLITLEWAMHTVAIGFGLCTASIGLYLKAYNETAVSAVCWIASPAECVLQGGECVDEAKFLFVGYLFGVLPMLSVPVVAVCNVLVYCKVRSTEQTRQRHDRSSDGVDAALSEAALHNRTRRVANQAFLYVVAFFNCLLWAVTVRNLDAWSIATRETEGDFFVLILLAHLSSPLQGFLNLLVYIRPRYLRMRTRYKELSRFGALYMALASVQSRERMMASLVTKANATNSLAGPCIEDGLANDETPRRRSITSIVLLEETCDRDRGKSSEIPPIRAT